MPVLEIALRDTSVEPDGLLIKVIIPDHSCGLPFVTVAFIFLCMCYVCMYIMNISCFDV